MGERRTWLSWPSYLITALSFTLGALTWQLISYWRQLLRQPALASVLPRAAAANLSNLTDQALHIAAGNVRASIEERLLPDGQRKLVLCAGWRNFREPWARDFGFASFGLVELNEIRALKETLELFLIYQKPDGQFPVKVHSTTVLDRYLHSLFQRQQPIRNPLRPKYKTAHNTVSLDGNSLLVIATLNYLRHFDDPAFADAHWYMLKQSLHWLEMQALASDGLLHQGAFTDWADSVVRIGSVHYTNVLYWKALYEFGRDAAKYGYEEDAAYFEARAEQLQQAINTHFWQEVEGFYATSQRFNHILSSAGNLLAIAWGLASPQQANRILDQMAAFGMADPTPTRVTNQPYGRAYIALENRLAGVPHYHTSAAWLWLGSWHVIALVRTGRLAEAKELLDRMCTLIVRDGVVHEVYGEDGRPLSTFWYKSEAPLTWSASLFIYANAVYHHALDAAL